MKTRIMVAVLAVVGVAIAARLALFQLGLASLPVEPFFGDGTRLVLTSPLSRALPIPDAALGAIGYAVELALVLAGGRDRERRHPWLVLAYGGLAGAMAVTALVLVAYQALVLHTGCTLCLASAALSFAIVGPAVHEARAALGHARLPTILHGR